MNDLRHNQININSAQAIVIFKMFYNARNRTKYERMLCLKQIISIIIHDKTLSTIKLKRELSILSKELNIEITKITKLPRKWRAKRKGRYYNVLDMRDSNDVIDNLFVIKWNYQSNIKLLSEEAERCLINIVEKPDYDLIPILREPLVCNFLNKTDTSKTANIYKVLLDNFNDLYIKKRVFEEEDIIEITRKWRTSKKNLYRFIDNDLILQSLLSMMQTKRIRTTIFKFHGTDKAKTRTETPIDLKFARGLIDRDIFRRKIKNYRGYNKEDTKPFIPTILISCLQPSKKQGTSPRINDPRFLYEFQKKVFDSAKNLDNPAQDRDWLTKEYLKTELIKIFKEEKRLKYERLLCIQTLFNLFYSETKDEDKTLEQLKKEGVLLQKLDEPQRSELKKAGNEIVDIQEVVYSRECYIQDIVWKVPHTNLYYLIDIDTFSCNFQTGTVSGALEKLMMLITPVADEFFSSDFAFFVFDNFHKIFDFKGEAVNLTERLFQEVKAKNMHFGKNIKAEKTCESQRLQNLFTKLLKQKKELPFRSYGFHKKIPQPNDLLKNVFSAFFIEPEKYYHGPNFEIIKTEKVDKSDLFLGLGLRRNQQFITHLQKSRNTVEYHIQHPKFIYLFQKYLFNYIKKGEKPELIRDKQVTNFEIDL